MEWQQAGSVARWVEDGGLVLVTSIAETTLLRVAGGPPILAFPATLSPAEQEVEGARLLWAILGGISNEHHGAAFVIVAALAALLPSIM